MHFERRKFLILKWRSPENLIVNTPFIKCYVKIDSRLDIILTHILNLFNDLNNWSVTGKKHASIPRDGIH